jgi:hypothetical protein
MIKKYLFIIFLSSFCLLINLNCQNIDNQNADSIFNIIDEYPKYPGGEKELYKFFLENFSLPQEINVNGNIYVQFIVEKDGSISNVKIIRGIGGGCDEEVVRVIKLMPNWIPAKKDGQFVWTFVTLPIEIRLD